MNRLTAFVLSILLLGQSFQVNAADMLQLDDLSKHLTEHMQESGDSVFEFISLHYGNQKIAHSNKHSQHKNLPFQQEIDRLSLSSFYTQDNTSLGFKLILVRSIKARFYYLDFQSSFDFIPIFQPPIHL